ncbi:hypothetical protein BGX21_003751, partial [Mortierella sp. AD011]
MSSLGINQINSSESQNLDRDEQAYSEIVTGLLNPAGGVGASNALHDAMVFANAINGPPFRPVADEIEAAFKAYQDELFQWAQNAFKVSKVHRTMVGQ